MWKNKLSNSVHIENINEVGKMYNFLPVLHQNLNHKLIKCFSNYIAKSLIQIIDNAKGLDLLFDKRVNDEDFEKTAEEIETYKSKEDLRYPQKYDSNFPIVVILEGVNGKKLKKPRIEAMFKRSRHSNISNFIVSQDFYELPKRTIKTNENL